jgi:hypothetical protein
MYYFYRRAEKKNAGIKAAFLWEGKGELIIPLGGKFW